MNGRSEIIERSPYMTHYVYLNNKMGATGRIGTAYPSGVHRGFIVGFMLLDL
jgi:hypothetical protein